MALTSSDGWVRWVSVPPHTSWQWPSASGWIRVRCALCTLLLCMMGILDKEYRSRFTRLVWFKNLPSYSYFKVTKLQFFFKCSFSTRYTFIIHWTLDFILKKNILVSVKSFIKLFFFCAFLFVCLRIRYYRCSYEAYFHHIRGKSGWQMAYWVTNMR